MLKLVHDTTDDAVGGVEVSVIERDALCRLAAKEMLTMAAELWAYLDAHTTGLCATGHRLVVGNGYARARQVVTRVEGG